MRRSEREPIYIPTWTLPSKMRYPTLVTTDLYNLIKMSKAPSWTVSATLFVERCKLPGRLGKKSLPPKIHKKTKSVITRSLSSSLSFVSNSICRYLIYRNRNVIPHQTIYTQELVRNIIFDLFLSRSF